MSPQRSHWANMGFVRGGDPVTITADADGITIDTRGFESVSVIFVVGESGDTLSGSVYIELELEDSPDNSTWTDCADADLTKSVTGTNTGTAAKIDAAAEDDVVVAVGYIGDKRYVRGVINITGTHTNGTPIGIVGLQGHPLRSPVNEA